MAETAATQMEKRVARLLTADWVQGTREAGRVAPEAARRPAPPRPAALRCRRASPPLASVAVCCRCRVATRAEGRSHGGRPSQLAGLVRKERKRRPAGVWEEEEGGQVRQALHQIKFVLKLGSVQNPHKVRVIRSASSTHA
jgi:hypothetical protein